jgi:hypothetical protein
MAQAFIGRDPVDPGKKLRILTESINVLMDFDKDLLCQIIGIIMVNDHFTYMPIDALLVLTNQQIEAIVARLRISDFL